MRRGVGSPLLRSSAAALLRRHSSTLLHRADRGLPLLAASASCPTPRVRAQHAFAKPPEGPELDSAIHEINAEMAELFGTAPGEDPPSQRDLPGLAQAASSHQSPHAPPGKSADLQSAALAALAAGMRDAAQAPGGGPVPLAAASPMPARAHTSSGAAVALHAKIVWATDELSRAAEPAKATELANLIGACARAASELGEPFAGRPPSQ
ncbi:hypothetical protein EMIHUDRAFT_206266 [Emiliania huxleyi CCMP1516]|uniref:Uncharacterized protein n=2 Tax=Emiliania huxleyi TaxID=2903 RepID=A0A0D3JNQ6_EMIH1|nr:hypothetical protein EMIHUDRAFT_206266 [Emiliania huxleyi CCMP1516]EOD25141.1 hypothetical protein EMIHUDRAFT_206266 [Emiliania huxleyi CCMP1516]|eukprot:XP_005777570.1 hypothetical protein EMIHUDRAFT_206266 [Emiliania huxleyi CCMP1516]